MQLSQSQKIYLNFFLYFMNVHKIWNTLKKKMSLTGYSFLKLKTSKAGLLKCLKNPMSEHLWTVNMLMGPKDS